MTAAEMDSATLRLQFLADSQSLPAETVRDLKSWWREKLREAGREKIIPFPEERGEPDETFEEMRFLR